MSIITFISYSCTQTESRTTTQAALADTLTVDQMVALAKANISEIKTKDFMALMEEGEPYTLIDVRTKAEHDAGYIPGAVNVPRGVLEFRIGSQAVWDGLGMYMPEKNEAIVIYCKKGSRGALATETLQKMGYTNVKNMSGGWLEWLSNFPDWTDKNETTGAALPAAGGGGGC